MVVDAEHWSGHPVLTRPADAAEEVDENVSGLVADLLDTMYAHPTCVGLAAPQIGYALRIAVIHERVTDDGEPLVLINPLVDSLWGKRETRYEACMSLPEWAGNVRRKLGVGISYRDDKGVARELRATDYLARVVQHEIDHLDGTLYPQRMRADDRLFRKDELAAHREAAAHEPEPQDKQ